jgi:phage shock protein PspC (stress-responsive transcriptional regulator)
MNMQKVITVNLNGNAYQLEEVGYEALGRYLEDAARQLADDPDCVEIVADLEQAIADKCARYIKAQKNVVTAGELDQVLKEMGPVETMPGEGEAPAAKQKDPDAAREAVAAPKRLYQINEGAWISGVCNGIAAYFAIDPTVVRIIFVALAFLTGGMWIIAYLIMMFVIPTAKTSEERAAARGLPFNAQELVDRAKRHYADLKEGHQRWRDKRRRAREREFWRPKREHHEPSHSRPFDQPQSGYGTRIAAGIVLPLAGIVSAVLTVTFIIALVSVLTTGEILGWELPREVPPWIGIFALVAAYAIVNVPLRAVRHASYEAVGPRRGWFVFWDGVLWIALVILVWWIAVNYVPGVREFFLDLFHNWRDIPFTVGHVFG